MTDAALTPENGRGLALWSRFKESNALFAFKAYAAWRLPLEIMLLASVGSLPNGPGATGMPPLDGSTWFHPWLRWDSAWYLRLAQNGYEAPACAMAEPMPCQSTMAFFPLYPIAVRVLHGLGLSWSAAMVIVPHIALWLGLWGLWSLTKKKMPNLAPESVVAAALCFPSSLFFSAGYTESIFLAVAVWAFVAFERRQWWLLFLCIALGCITRRNGPFLGMAVFFGALVEKQWKGAVATAAGCVVGFGGFMLFMYEISGSPFTFLHAHKAWGFTQSGVDILQRHFGAIWHGGGLPGIVDAGSVVVLAAAAVISFRKLGFGYGLLCALTVAAPMAFGHLWGFARIALSTPPMFIALALSLSRPWLARGLLVFGLASVVLEGFFFVHGLGVN